MKRKFEVMPLEHFGLLFESRVRHGTMIYDTEKREFHTAFVDFYKNEQHRWVTPIATIGKVIFDLPIVEVPGVILGLSSVAEKLTRNINYWRKKRKLSDIGLGTIDGLKMALTIVESHCLPYAVVLEMETLDKTKQFSQFNNPLINLVAVPKITNTKTNSIVPLEILYK